jgi:hypothetical protein
MKKAIIVLAIVISGICLHANQFELDAGSITFEAPDSFTELKKEEIDLKYPSKRAPNFVVGNKSRSTTIAYDIKPHPIPENELEARMKFLEQTFDRMIPGIEWKKKEIIEKEGKKWIYFEMTSHAIDTDIYNIILVTPYKGKTLMFNFNSTREEFPKIEKELRASIESIRIKNS